MLINWLHERITSLRGTHAFAYLVDMSQLLRSGRLALHLVRRINQRFLSNPVIGGKKTLT
ncbi:hypothetical protein [Nitrosomonas ureae]|uniref:Uncharacterized protein n=1 Tax=Nitrosomonas ureae TaxID=44577 RepID=A0A1H5TNU1_9PROT|nr:hypothetical protein [Nitrosomonas ureae]SEF64440.1 hypothetical protein SAMN05216334_10583 [Nitrosomonas ureae]